MTKLTQCNLVVIRGELSSHPEIRLLDSGTRLAQLQVRVPSEGTRSTNVPVAVWDPPSAVEALVEGDHLTILGRVERRFFRTRDGRTGSRVEVVATDVVPKRDRRRCATVLRRACRTLDETPAR